MSIKSIAALGFGAILMLSACGGPDRNDEGEITEEGELDVFSIKVGDCFADPDVDEVLDVAAVPCDEEHKYQAYALFDLRAGLLPDEDEMYDLASEGCFAEFETYVGLPYPDSELFITWFEPTQESWDQGDREIVCELYLEDDLLTVDAKGSGL